MDLELANKLLGVPQRENAGARSSNRFTYQQVWAFDYMLEVMNSGFEFILFMEFHDDIIVLDRTSSPQMVEFYQIKTDDKDSRHITSAFIVQNASKYPKKMSIAQKMIDDFVKFESNTRGIHLVSNKSFDFGTLQDSTESKLRNTVLLNEINDKEIMKIKKGMCKACNKQNNCNEECLKLIYFDVSNLDLVTYEDTVLGRLMKKMDALGIQSTIEKTRSIYNTIMGEIRRINNSEKMSRNVNELLKKKSISKEQFLNWISQLKVDMPDNLWNQIQPLLLADGFKPLEINNIFKQWKKYQIDVKNVETMGICELSIRVREIMCEKEFDNSKNWVEYIYSIVCNETKAKIYCKEYLYALIIKEMFS